MAAGATRVVEGHSTRSNSKYSFLKCLLCKSINDRIYCAAAVDKRNLK